MKHFVFAFTFLSVLSLPTYASVRCEGIRLNTFSSITEERAVVLTQPELFDLDSAFGHYLEVSGHSRDKKIPDLKVEVLKSELFDEFEKRFGGFISGVNAVKVYALKVRLSSESTVLGSVFSGCIPQGVKEIEAHTLCTETTMLLNN